MSYGNNLGEEYMSRMISAMSRLGYPVMFKGAMVLKTATQRKVHTSRMTKDLDLEWKMQGITNEKLFDLVKLAMRHAGLDLVVTQTRQFAERRSASFAFTQKNSSIPVFTMDIKIDLKNLFYSSYFTADGVEFNGASLEKMYTDKAVAISTKTVFRRIKDVYDLYLLSHFSGFKLSRIAYIINQLDMKIGDYTEFLNDVDSKHGLKYAYSKLQDIENKPDFDVIYGRVKLFVEPLISKYSGDNDYKWDVNNGWQQL